MPLISSDSAEELVGIAFRQDPASAPEKTAAPPPYNLYPVVEQLVDEQPKKAKAVKTKDVEIGDEGVNSMKSTLKTLKKRETKKTVLFAGGFVMSVIVSLLISEGVSCALDDKLNLGILRNITTSMLDGNLDSLDDNSLGSFCENSFKHHGLVLLVTGLFQILFGVGIHAAQQRTSSVQPKNLFKIMETLSEDTTITSGTEHFKKLFDYAIEKRCM